MQRGTGSDGRIAAILWTVAGGLLLLSVVTETLADLPSNVGGGFGAASRVFVAVALIVLALGRFGPGSVTAFRPLGTSALVAFAVVWAIAPYLLALFVTPDAQSAPVSAAITANIVTQVVELALAAIASVEIARAGVVPRPWSWAPAWVVAVDAVTNAATFLGNDSSTALQPLILPSLFAVIAVGMLAKSFLGVLAIVLADRSRPERPAPRFSATSHRE